MSNGLLLTCDLFCLGVPSPEVFQEFLGWLGKDAAETVVGYSHRGHAERWGEYGEVAYLLSGRTLRGTTNIRVWQRIWSTYLIRESCYHCGYHSMNRPGDISIGDFWGAPDLLPGLADEHGLSCLIASTSNGLKLVESSMQNLALYASDIKTCANDSQPMLLHPPSFPSRRSVFWETLTTQGFDKALGSVGVKGLFRVAKDLVKGVFGDSDGKQNYGDQKRQYKECESRDIARLILEGAYPYVFGAKNRLDSIRAKSSSGGAYHALASAVIDRGGVVYGCAFDESLRAIHIRCETVEQAERCMGSKYSQSRMGRTITSIMDDLQDGRMVLFTGTPCQVDAVNKICGGLSYDIG